MYRLLLVSVLLANLTLPMGARERPLVWVPNAREADSQCSRLVVVCVGDCGPVDENSGHSCADKCLPVTLCETEGRRFSRSNLPDDNLPESSLPHGRLPDDKLPDSHLP